MVSKTKSGKNTIPTGNIIMIGISHHIILIIGDSVLLGLFKLGDEVLDVYGMDTKFI